MEKTGNISNTIYIDALKDNFFAYNQLIANIVDALSLVI
jgi:hypothetical protein